MVDGEDWSREQTLEPQEQLQVRFCAIPKQLAYFSRQEFQRTEKIEILHHCTSSLRTSTNNAYTLPSPLAIMSSAPQMVQCFGKKRTGTSKPSPHIPKQSLDQLERQPLTSPQPPQSPTARKAKVSSKSTANLSISSNLKSYASKYIPHSSFSILYPSHYPTPSNNTFESRSTNPS